MLRLILMRHSKAEPASGAGDHARALSNRGRREAKAAGLALADLARPDMVLLSDSTRTLGTLAGVAAAYPSPLPHRATRSLYNAAPDAILREIGAVPAGNETLLVIGHNPGIGDLVRRLVGHPGPSNPALAALRAGFPTSCFASIGFDAARWSGIAGPGRLQHLSTVH